MDHLNGLLDSSIHAMIQAANQESNSPYLYQVALSNAADLYVHAGDLKVAADLYKKCLSINCEDFHSLMGLGWIALAHDKNDSLSERIFEFVKGKNKLPDPLFKLTQMAQMTGDSMQEKKWALAFESEATENVYGNMYNKYMIELYTGILQNPSKAEEISMRELENRATAQTYAWYAWSLFSNNKKKEAYEVFEKNVSGRPLEGLELYWMGKMMQGMNKEYNARSFFKAALINKYDLNPAIREYLEKQLR
jgi:tetratricopeptide (TPR) repeat protein